MITINFACGHKEERNVYGTGSVRANKKKYLERQECSDCANRSLIKKKLSYGTHEIVEVHYSEYKNNKSKYIAVPDSYNADTKTIKVLAEKAEEEQETLVEKFEREVMQPNNYEVSRDDMLNFMKNNIGTNETQEGFSKKLREELKKSFAMDINPDAGKIIFTKIV